MRSWISRGFSTIFCKMEASVNFLIFSYGFSVVPTCFCPWTLNLHIAIVLLRLRVHYSVEIKRYKSQIELEFNEDQIPYCYPA